MILNYYENFILYITISVYSKLEIKLKNLRYDDNTNN
jgi:hypothetical protein